MIRNRMINLDQITIQETERFWKGGNFNLDISFIDIQHLWLVYLVLKIERTVSTSKSDVIENFSDFIVELDEYADVHFRIEEEMLEYFSFPGMRQHEEKHQAFESQISEFRSRESFSREEGEKVVRFLKSWLGTHILKEDKSYSDYFAKDKARLYDFSEELILSGKFSFTDEQKILYDRVEKLTESREADYKKIVEKAQDYWNRFKLKTGIPIIDVQHLWLVFLILDLENSVGLSREKQIESVRKIAPEVKFYIDEHFKIEEFLMQKAGFPQFEDHKKLHLNFLSFLGAVDLNQLQDLDLIKLVKSLKEWLYSHIALDDKKYISSMQMRREYILEISRQLIKNGVCRLKKPQMEFYKEVCVI